MKWVTREHPRTDRIACPWIIRKFIDPAAEIVYVGRHEVLTYGPQRNGPAERRLRHRRGTGTSRSGCAARRFRPRTGGDAPKIGGVHHPYRITGAVTIAPDARLVVGRADLAVVDARRLCRATGPAQAAVRRGGPSSPPPTPAASLSRRRWNGVVLGSGSPIR